MKIKLFSAVLGILGVAAAVGLFDGSVGAEGARISHHGNGQMKESTHFIDGRRHGETSRWYSDGTLRAQGTYEGGQMVGEWIWQMPDGSPDSGRSGTYEDGRRITL